MKMPKKGFSVATEEGQRRLEKAVEQADKQHLAWAKSHDLTVRKATPEELAETGTGRREKVFPGSSTAGIPPTYIKHKSRRYTRETVQQVAKAVLVDGDSINAAAERFGVPVSTAYVWCRDARKKQLEFLTPDELEEKPCMNKKAPAPKSEPVVSTETPVAPKPPQSSIPGSNTPASTSAGQGSHVDAPAATPSQCDAEPVCSAAEPDLAAGVEGLEKFLDAFEDTPLLTTRQREILTNLVCLARTFVLGTRWAKAKDADDEKAVGA